MATIGKRAVKKHGGACLVAPMAIAKSMMPCTWWVIYDIRYINRLKNIMWFLSSAPFCFSVQVNCKTKSDADAKFKLIRLKKGDQFRVAGTNLCLQKIGRSKRIVLKSCQSNKWVDSIPPTALTSHQNELNEAPSGFPNTYHRTVIFSWGVVAIHASTYLYKFIIQRIGQGSSNKCWIDGLMPFRRLASYLDECHATRSLLEGLVVGATTDRTPTR